MLKNEIEIEPKDGPGPMHHREITLADGRYMIFYTFDGSEPHGSAGGAAPKTESTPVNSGSRPPADAGDSDTTR